MRKDSDGDDDNDNDDDDDTATAASEPKAGDRRPTWGVCRGPTGNDVAPWWSLFVGKECTTVMVDGPAAGIASELDAKSYLLRYIGNDDRAYFVAFDGPAELEPTDAHKHRVSFQKATEAYKAVVDKVTADIKSAVSANVGCKACGSKIARKHLKDHKCLVCGESLAPPSSLKRMKNSEINVAKCAAVVDDDRKKPPLRKKGAFFLVGMMPPA